MECTIAQEKQNTPMKRKELTLACQFPKGPTPSKEQLKKTAAELLKADPELTIIKHVQQRYGVANAQVIVYVYATKEDYTRYEIRNKKAKKAEAAAPTPAPAKK